MMTYKFTTIRKRKLRDAFDVMTFGIDSGKWLKSSASLYSKSNEYDGILYERVFYESKADIKSGWVSKKYMATDNKKKYTTNDHAKKPQFGGKFLMDNPTIWYGEFDKFLEWSAFFSIVIPVTKTENNKLRHETQYMPLEESYASAGIELFQEGGVGYDATPYDPFEDLPELFKDYQKDFLKKVA